MNKGKGRKSERTMSEKREGRKQGRIAIAINSQ
jgi:hypothetical protein